MARRSHRECLCGQERRYEGSGAPEYFLSFETPDEAQTLCGFLRLRLPKLVAAPATAEPEPEPEPEPELEPEPGSEGGAGRGVSAFPELEGCALIRELHVYGKLVVADATARTDTEPSAAGAGVAEGRTNSRGRSIVSGGSRAAICPPVPGTSTAAESQHGGFGRRLMARAEEIAAEAGYTRLAVISGVGVRNYYRRLGYELTGEGQFQICLLYTSPSPRDS